MTKRMKVSAKIATMVVTLAIVGVMMSSCSSEANQVAVSKAPSLSNGMESAAQAQTFDSKKVDWQQNGTNQVYVTQLISGELTEPVSGTIKTDTNCDADKEGLSHCHNDIQLDNGKNITVINSHNMKNHPCFDEGNKVKVEPLGAGWAKVTKL